METISRVTIFLWEKFVSWIKEEKNQTRLVVGAFIVSMIPMLILSFYNHPAMDDFNYTILTRQALIENEGLAKIPAVLQAAVQRAINNWNNWQGTYTFSIICALRPSIISEKLTFTHTFILLGLFIWSFLYFSKIVLHRLLGLSKQTAVIVALAVGTLCIQYVPYGVEAFYWWTGSVGYTGLLSVVLFLMGNLIDSMRINHLSRKRFVGVLLLEIVLAGGHFPTGLLTAVLMALYMLDILANKKYQKTMKIQSVVQFVVYVAGFLLCVISPGNARRQSFFEHRTPFQAIYKSYTKALAYIWEEGLNVVIVLVLIALFVYMFYKLRDSKYSFKCPLMFTLVSYSMSVVLWVPAIYAVQYVSAARYFNLVYYAMVLFLAANAIYYAGWLRRQYEKCEEKVRASLRGAAPILMGIVCLFSLAIGFRYIDIVTDLEEITSATALKSLVYGEAKVYHEELKAREELYNDPDIQIVEVEPLTYMPELLYIGTLTDNPDDGRNLAMCGYYNKEYMVEVVPEEETEEESDTEEASGEADTEDTDTSQ